MVGNHANELRSLIEPVVAALGFELAGIKYVRSRQHGLLRVYIDSDRGITVDDCEIVSHQISGLLDVEDPISGQYTLEVSSPGFDRPLFWPEHFQRFAGHRLRVKMSVPLDGRRNFTGELIGLRDGMVVIREAGEEHALPLEWIGSARLAPDSHTVPKS